MMRFELGQTRQQQQSKDSSKASLEEEVAWFVGGIIAGTIIVPNPTLAIAEALVNLVPAFLPPTLRADISAQAARLVLTDPPTPSKGAGALSAANRENLKYRVAYGFAAIKRLTKAVQGPGGEIGERLDKALRAEGSYLEAHRNAGKRRLRTAEMIEQAVATYGPVLSWRAVKRSTSRHHHLAADGMNWNASNGPPRATGALPGVLPNCLVGSAIVEASGVLATYAREYEGEVIEIGTDLGSHLTVTPNHPILTSIGWVAAGSLHEGDDVIGGAFGERMVRGPDTDHHYGPAPIEQISEAMRCSPRGWHASVPTAREHFHGDGMDAEVHIVGTDSLLLDTLDPPPLEPLCESGFRFRDVELPALASQRAFASFSDAPSASSHGSVGRFDVAPLVFGSSLGLHEALSIEHGPYGSIGFLQSPTNRGTRDAKRLSDSLLRLSRQVSTDNISNGQCELPSLGPHQFAFMESVSQDPLRDSSLLRRSLVVEAVNVKLHRIVKRSSRWFTGQVYNLQTESGWYVSEDIITHNCLCSFGPPIPGAKVMQ